MRDQMIGLSCFISKILRHDPSAIGITLEYDGGWANVDELIEGLRAVGRTIDRDILDRIVRNDEKVMTERRSAPVRGTLSRWIWDIFPKSRRRSSITVRPPVCWEPSQSGDSFP